jgi:hypothetical protein
MELTQVDEQNVGIFAKPNNIPSIVVNSKVE